MLDRFVARALAAVRGLRRLERRELAALRRWVEDTGNLLHLTVALAVPLLIGLVTVLADTFGAVSFLLFPPLASGTYTLFADPEGQYSSPRRFVGGLTAGAVSGWVALEVSAHLLYDRPPGVPDVHAPSAALAVFLTAVVTWGLDLELPTAFSTALLVLITGTARLAYVAGMVLSAGLVAGAFVLWRDRFYEQRARYLYGAVRGDDRVLVPVTGRNDRPTASLAAALAAAHDAGKVVLLDVVDDERIAAAERELLAEGDDGVDPANGAPGGDGEADRGEPVHGSRGDDPRDDPAAGDATDHASGDDGEDRRAADDDRNRPSADDARDRPAADDAREAATRHAGGRAAARLEREAARIRERTDVPCEVVVATGDPVGATLATADEADCDLVAASLAADGEDDGSLTPLVRGVFAADVDAVALRSATGAESWDRVLVMVSRTGEVAHAMVNFAERLAEEDVALCTCIDREVERRRAETRLANLAETARGEVETRVSRSAVDDFLAAAATGYDLVVVGSSGERSRASRLVAPPVYRRIVELDLACDVLVVD